MSHDIPNEILHYTERDEYKEWKRRQKVRFLENVVFVLLIATIIALSVYSGRLIERHFGVERDILVRFIEKKGAYNERTY